jgi:protein subunit release factor B
MPKELLFSITKDDFEIETFRSGGKGGQYQNTTDSGVRIRHKESGAVGESRTERSQLQNKKLALRRLVASTEFQIWHKKKSFEILGAIKTEEQLKKEVEKIIERDLQNGNIKIEYYNKQSKRWEEE